MTRIGRPGGYAPKGTSAGIIGFLLTSAAIPPLAAQVAAPWLSNAVDTSGWSTLAGGVFSMVLFAPVVAAIRARRYWFICYLFGTGSVLVGAYVLIACLGLAYPLGLLSRGNADETTLTEIGLVMLLIISPAPILLARTLRLKYWQPWTTPDQWEIGDEQAPAWAVAVTGIGTSARPAQAAPPVQPTHKRRRRGSDRI